MTSWLEGMPTGWLVLVAFGGTFLVVAAIWFAVVRVAAGPNGNSVTAISPGLLSPMGIVFGLIVGFLVAGLWADLSDARDAVDHEASALRSTILVAAASFPGQTSQRMDALIDQHIRDAANKEWPAMANQHATLTSVPVPLARALHLALTLHPRNPEQTTGQRELVTSIEAALDARRQRVIVSQSSVGWVKWVAVIALGTLTLIAIGCVHSGNRRTAAVAMGIFGTAVAVTVVLIAAQARPFKGEFGIKPDALLQVAPTTAAGGPQRG